MGRIYVYSPTETDCSTIGLVGALLPTEAVFDIKAGEFGELTLSHPVDPWGKWKALQSDCIIKAPVPVRLCPIFQESDSEEVDTFETVIYHYRVKNGVPTDERTLWKGSAEDNKTKVKVLNGGTKVTVKKVNFASGRWKVTAKIKGKKYTGWIKSESLEETGEPQTVITDPDVNSYEDIDSSYAVKDQLFRIIDVEKSDDNGGTVNVTAMRIVYDLSGVPTRYSTTGTVTGAKAAKSCLKRAFLKRTGYTVYSNVLTEHVGFDGRGKSVIQALCDPDGGIASVFGAQLITDDYDIYMLANAGMDRGVTIRYGKNLLGVVCDIDTTDIVEGILPIGESESGNALYINSDTNIGSGYERRNDGSGDGTKCPEIIYKIGVTTPSHRVLPLKVSDAKVNKKNGITVTSARKALVDAAHEAFESGCYLPAVSLDVDFLMLGDTDEYAEYKHLESLFVYDTVHIHHKELGIDVSTTLTELSWDCLGERVIGAHFGDMSDLSATVSSYQIGSVNGSKLMPGSVSGTQLGDGAIKENNLDVDSINADAINATAIASQKISTAIFNATSAEINRLSAGIIESGEIDTDKIDGALAVFDIIRGTYADLNEANVKTLIAQTLHVTEPAEINQIYAKYIEVSYLNAANAWLGRCVLKGEDGNWYEMRIDSSGAVYSTQTTAPSASEQQSGVTAGGKSVVADTSIREMLTEEGAIDNLPTVLGELEATTIRADTFFGREATIGTLRTVQITSQRDGEPLYFGNMMNDLRDGMKLSRSPSGAQVEVGDITGGNVAKIDKNGMGVIVTGKEYSRFASSYAQFGEYQMRKTADGGLAFKLA